MKKLLAMALVFTLGACASTGGERDTASSDAAYHYVPAGFEK
ncbi:MAG TPA: hypothetical protein VM901_09490 [Bdellovibrionota bacterium]|nr:hypothetical protein [Bdellovibrionota bacterium]